MANPPIGNSWIEGELGVLQLEFDSLDLGYTTDATELEFIEDVADTFYQQFGTQPYDKIPTGQAYQLTCMLGQINPERLAKIARGITISGDKKSMKAGSDLYRSGRTNFAKQLIARRVDSSGAVSTDPRFKFIAPKAFPMPSGNVSFEASTQKALSVTFYLFKDSTLDVFFYTGYASSLGL